MRSLPMRFPNLEAIRVDEGAEAGTVLPFARSDARLSLITQGFIASVNSNMELWGALAARLHAQTLSIPRDERMLIELRGLRREEFALGAKWRVVDAKRKFHRDLTISLAGACMLAGTTERCPHCDDPGCGGYHLFYGAPPKREEPKLEARGSWGGDEPEDGDDEPEVIEATEEEVAARPDRDEWVPLSPRAERKRQHHANVDSIAKTQGWFPEDDLR
jgi:hypothetical protein